MIPLRKTGSDRGVERVVNRDSKVEFPGEVFGGRALELWTREACGLVASRRRSPFDEAG